MGKKSNIFIITICVILFFVLLGVISFFLIANRHRERCITRYLFDEGLLRNVIFDEDPMNISNEHCDLLMDLARSSAREQIRIPCDVSEDQMFLRDLENLGLLKSFYERNGDILAARNLMVDVAIRVNLKCRGLQNSSENPIDAF